ncbi:MAG: EamA family transporter, partial [Eggerthellaceae bacterium]|nr:EamA family transporter [Eggerthellaceae bacterium]
MRCMNNMQANICLLAVTLCWSCEIVLLALVPKEVNPFATNCTTSLIAALLLGACFYRRIVATFKRDGFVLARRIALLGVLYATYNVLIEEGIDYFNVSASAFTLSMTAVVLPVLLFVLRRGVDTRTWVSVIYVTAGIAIAMYPSFEHAQAPGIVIMI